MDSRARGLSLVSLVLVLLLAPLTAGIQLIEDRVLIYGVILVPSDLPLLVLVLLVGWRVLRRRERPPLGTGAALFALLVALLALAFVTRPSAIGAQMVFRMIGALAIAVTVADLAAAAERRFLWATLGLVAVCESVLSVAQVISGGPVGVVGEAPAPLLVHGASLVPRGTFLHPYPLAGTALIVAIGLLGRGIASGRAAAWSAAASAAIVPVGMTYSRAALAGFVAGLAVLAWPALSRPAYRGALLALVLGAGIPALIWNDGWVTRAEQRDTSASYRLLLQDQALGLIAEQPLLGVGTGRYISAARERFPDPPRPLQPVHSVPLIVAAEAGIPAGLACVLLIAVLGWRSLLTGWLDAALFLMFVPYVVFDVYPYVGWQGPVLLGLWIGTLDLGAERRALSRRARPLRVLAVIPGSPERASMIFARRQVASLRDLGVDARTFYLGSRTPPIGLLRELVRLRLQIARDDPDLVHAHFGTVTAFLCAVATTSPLVITYRGSDLHPVRGSSPLRTAVAHLLSQVAALRAARIICVNDRLRERLWWRRDVVAVIPSGVDTTLFAPEDRAAARRRLGWDVERRYVLFNAGRDPRLKRLDLALAAMDEVRRSRAGAELVVLDGTVDPVRIPTFMNAADCLLLTSDHEGSPNVVKEAIACGLPVVTVDVGDVRERLSGVHPSAVIARDPLELGGALVHVLSERRRSNGPTVAPAFSLELVAAQVRSAYEGALAATAGWRGTSGHGVADQEQIASGGARPLVGPSER